MLLKKLRFSNFQLIIRFLKKYYIFIKLIPSYLKVSLNEACDHKKTKKTPSLFYTFASIWSCGWRQYQAYLIINTLKNIIKKWILPIIAEYQIWDMNLILTQLYLS